MTLRFGRYETIQPLASGGMAAVYLGRAVGAGGFERRVAIKVMHEHIASDPEFVAMFLDEARLAARIHHPNVVGTIDVQESEQGMFLVMDYIEGASLKGVLRGMRKRRQRIPYGITVRILCDALSGLHAAHDLKGKGGKALNLVHRDVSPHNILVGTDGVCRITDFGVARAEARLSTTRGGQLKGKIAYMPPEQGLGNHVDRRADVYAAGVCLWEMLVGRRLFKAEHDGQLVAMVLRGADRSPIDAISDIPQPLNDICMRALSLEPDARFATAAHFAEALENALHDAAIRIASTRQVAAFVDEFKVEITHNSVPPVHAQDSVTGLDSMPSVRASLASMPEPSESSVDGQASSVAGPPSVGPSSAWGLRKNYVKVAAALGITTVTAILVVAVAGGSGRAPAQQPAVAVSAVLSSQRVPPSPAPIGEPAAPGPSSAPAASTAPDAQETPKSVMSVMSADAKPPPAPAPQVDVPSKRRRKRSRRSSGNPLDFDTDTL